MSSLLTDHAGWLLLSALLGAIAGTAELLSRYKDEPLVALASSSGSAYLALNAVVAASAYGLIIRFGHRLVPGVGGDKLWIAILAGFGSMLVLRSKLFNIRTERGEDLGFGLDALLLIFLRSVDRRIDRNRSASRQKLVAEAIKNISDPVQAVTYLRVSLSSYQNLSEIEKSEIDGVILKVQSDKSLAPQMKLMAILFGFLNICGEKNFQSLISQLRDHLNSLQDPS